MPFESKSQQRFMFARHPKMAKKWAKETPDIKSLPEKKKESMMWAQLAVASNAFELAQMGKEKVGMKSVTMNAFFEELEKLSAEQQEPEMKHSILQRLGANTIGGIGSSAVGGGANALLAKSLRKGELTKRTSLDDVEKLKKSIDPKAKVVYDKKGRLEGAMHIGFDGRGESHVPRKAGPHIAAHELGHGSFRRGTVGRTTALLRAGNPLGQAAAGIMSMQDPDSTTSKMAPVVGALSSVPTMVDEGVASYKAIQGMRRSGFNPAQVALGKKQLLKAFGTYGLQTATAVGAPMLTRQVLKKMKKNTPVKAKEKTALDAHMMGRVADKAVKRGWSGARENLSLMRLAKREGRAVEKAVGGVHAPEAFADTVVRKTNMPTRAAKVPAAPVAAAAVGGTQAGIAPKSLPQTSAIAPHPPTQGAPQQPASKLRRTLAFGGGMAALGGLAGYAMPHKQQQQPQR